MRLHLFKPGAFLAAWVISFLFSLPASGEIASFGSPTLFNSDWLFNLADTPEAANPDFDDSGWRKLDLPHDWSIEHQASPTLASCTGYLPGGIGWYRKTFEVTDDQPLHYVYFEGIYNRSDVYINGHHLGHRPNGYVSMLYDLTPYLVDGPNTIAVRVDHSRYADSRWYTGSGIYRDVYLLSAPDTHFSLWGIGWEATSISAKKATVKVSAAIDNPQKGQTLKAELLDADGKTVATKTVKNPQQANTLELTVSAPKLWDTTSPYLYRLRTSLIANGQEIDSNTEPVGLRTLSFDPNTGFALNGKNMKVKGVCLHHDAGTLGAVVPEDVWRRRLANLKEMGANAIRTSHNPQAPIVYDICDEIGLLVMDEISDEWEFPKRKWVQGWNVGEPSYDGTYDFFEEWIERDITDMVMRDRNHPCIFLWSIGNEVDYPNDPYSHPVLDGAKINQPMFGGYKPEAPAAERIGKIAKRLVAKVKEVDTSRPTTGALAGVVMSNETEYPEAVDICGYNYTEDRYQIDHETYPDRVIYGSENGVGYEAWRAVTDNDHIFGQFIWTGTDYLGESGRWPSRGLNTGLLDFASLPKPRGQFRKALWSEEPFTYIGTTPIFDHPRRPGAPDKPERPWLSIDAPDTWNYEDGQPVRVVCYTNAPYARLLLNGKQVGDVKSYDSETGIIYWDVPFSAGELKAEGCDQNGSTLSQYSIQTSGLPYALTARIDGDFTSKTGGVNHVLIEVVDDQGRWVNLADNNISCHIQGPAQLLGLEGSDNSDMGDYTDNRQRSYRGRLLAYVKNTEGEGPVTITFTSPLLKKTSLTLPLEK